MSPCATMRSITVFLLVFLATALLFVSCANIASPDGGRFDEEPPVVVSAKPADKAINISTKRISILFNEYIKLTGANEKVIVSPPQLEAANVRADGKRVRVTLYDSLQSNTTYTIDFGDAIEDYNEGNPMGFYTYSFSTGSQIDTMEISGHVFAAENLEPVKGALVGLHRADSTYADSLFHTKPFIRVARTNGSGQFCIKGVAPGSYRVFALQDGDGDFRFSQKSEAVAFDTTIYVPSSMPDLRMDTCWRDSIYYDSIRVVPYTHYLPDNIVMRTFLEGKQDLHLLKTERTHPDWFRLYFTAPMDTLPIIKGLNFDESCLRVEATQYQDTVTYWITDTAFTHTTDTAEFLLKHLDTDSLGNIVWVTDTQTLVSRNSWSKIRDERQKKIDDWYKQRQKRIKRSKKALPHEDNPFEKEFLELKLSPTGALAPNQNVSIIVNEPITSLDTAAVHLYVVRDSNLYEEPFVVEPTPFNARSYTLYAQWQPGFKYAVLLDSMAIEGAMGHVSKKLRSEFLVRTLDEFGTLIVNIISPDTSVVVQLLNGSDKVVQECKASPEGVAEFYYLRPEIYFMRCFIDQNSDGKWDTGEYDTQRQAEPVFYFPKPMNVRAGWDVEQAWEIHAIPVHQQKPKNLIKQKADNKRTPSERNKEREEEKARRSQKK